MDEVRDRYATAALTVLEGRGAAEDADGNGCCAPEDGLGQQLYDALERAELPDEAVLASLGCGNPTAVAELREGETVLDLGSGGGIDVLLSAKRVGPDREGLRRRHDRGDASARPRERGPGRGDERRVPGGPDRGGAAARRSIDVVISNCVVNLSTDKPAVLHEMFRLLRPGGRIGISDVVAEDRLTPDDRAERGSFVGCIAGALSFSEYELGLRAAGFADVEITATHELIDGMHGAIIRAGKPA